MCSCSRTWLNLMWTSGNRDSSPNVGVVMSCFAWFLLGGAGGGGGRLYLFVGRTYDVLISLVDSVLCIKL